MGIALFHLLPESDEAFKDYFPKDSIWYKLPNAYFIAFMCYSLILFIEKVAFNSHALIEHDHGDGHGHAHDGSHSHAHGDSKKEPLRPALNMPPQELESGAQDDEDEDEETIKNVVSSRGKFASFLQQRNILTSGGSMIGKPNKSLLKASHILRGKHDIHDVDEVGALLVSPNKIDIEDRKDQQKESKSEHLHEGEEFVPKSNITPYLLLAALSFHGLFEGIAMGLQGGYNDTLFLFIAIISHKWAEAFTLGISFSKAQTDKVTFIRLILLFSLFTPIGIIIGILLSSQSKIVEAIFLALSTGTFLYVAASEVIVEEFAVTKYKYSKFICYILGGVLIGVLAVIEQLGEGHGHSHDD